MRDYLINFLFLKFLSLVFLIQFRLKFSIKKLVKAFSRKQAHSQEFVMQVKVG